MALSESDIKIIIAAELKKKGFKDAEKATNKLDEGFKRLGGTIATVFSGQQIINFSKLAVKGFIEDERAAMRFEQALKNVNLGFASPEIENYLENLERQTGVLKDDLRPAFQSLAQTTRSVYKSQDILNTAIDTAAGTGYDLNTVIKDLTRAYLGNNNGLLKYNLGLSRAELKTTSFAKVQELLNKQFTGQQAAYLETYAGRLQLINVAYDRMSDTIGEALLDSFQMLTGDAGIGGATDAMDRFGIMAADVIRGVGVLISSIPRIPFFDQLQYLSQFPQLMKIVDKLMNLGKAQRPLFFPTGGIGQPAVDARLKAIEEAAIKRQKELEALRLKSLRAQEKANRLKRISLQLMEKEKKFDLTRIQLAAAMQGKLTDEERRRVEELKLIEDIKQAIAEQDVEKAEKLMDELERLRKETLALADTLINLKAGNPFEDWDEYVSDARKLLSTLFPGVDFNKIPLGIENDYVPQITPKYPNQKPPLTTPENFVTIPEPPMSPEVLSEILGGIDVNSLQLGAEGDYLPASGRAGSPTVVVNIAGNMVAERDLIDAVTEGLYQIQKRGQSITLSAVGL